MASESAHVEALDGQVRRSARAYGYWRMAETIHLTPCAVYSTAPLAAEQPPHD